MRQGQTKVGRKQQNKRETGTQRGTRELFRVRKSGKAAGGREKRQRKRGEKRDNQARGWWTRKGREWRSEEMGRSGKARRFDEAGGRRRRQRPELRVGREESQRRRGLQGGGRDRALSLFFLFFWGGRRISAEITQPSPLPRVPARGRSCINTRGGGAGLLQRGQRQRRRLCCH